MWAPGWPGLEPGGPGGRKKVGENRLPFLVPRWRPKEPHDGLAGGGKQLGKGEACALTGFQLQVLPLDFSYPGLLAFSSLEKTDFQIAGADRRAEKGQGLLPTATAYVVLFLRATQGWTRMANHVLQAQAEYTWLISCCWSHLASAACCLFIHSHNSNGNPSLCSCLPSWWVSTSEISNGIISETMKRILVKWSLRNDALSRITAWEENFVKYISSFFKNLTISTTQTLPKTQSRAPLWRWLATEIHGIETESPGPEQCWSPECCF